MRPQRIASIVGGKHMRVSKAFRFSGRIGRREFWVTSAAVFSAVVVITLLVALVGGAGQAPGAIGGAVGVFCFGVGVWVSTAASVKRLHDTGRSGWLLAKLTGLSVLLYAFTFFAAAGSDQLGKYMLLIGAIGYIAVNFYMWYLIGFKRGDDSPNVFGPPSSSVLIK